MIFIRILGLCMLVLLILWITTMNTAATAESMTTYSALNPPPLTGQGTGSYLLSKSSIQESPQEVKENIYTVDSAGEHSQTEYDIKYHSKEKINCISPAVYNAKTFECDCFPGSEYNDIYGCVSKCTDYQGYSPDDNTCINICYGNDYYDDVSGLCIPCPIGTKNDGNNVCLPMKPCPPGQRYTKDSPMHCKTCPSGFIFNDAGVCVQHCETYETDRNGVGICDLKCPIQYQYWDNSLNQCMDCAPGEISNEVNRCVPSPFTCRAGETYATIAPYECVSTCKDYERWDDSVNGGNCIYKCNRNQRFSRATGSCIDCPFGEESDGKDGCIPIKVTPKPTPSCPAGFDLCSNYTQCDTICPYWRYNAEDDATNCEKICPLPNQFYDQLQVNIINGSWTYGNNGCADCPTGYLVNDNNECTWCDEAGGYSRRNPVDNRSNVLIQGDPCQMTCDREWEAWDNVTQSCERYCRKDGTSAEDIQDDKEVYFNRIIGDCDWCPTGYLNDKDANECTICDTANGYESVIDPLTKQPICQNKCKPWERWDKHAGVDRTGACIYHCEADDQLYDTVHDECRTCEDKHPNKFIVSTDKKTNTCQYMDKDPETINGTPRPRPKTSTIYKDEFTRG